jgi:60 kDa SS-A/Ro ribonucleoprotein
MVKNTKAKAYGGGMPKVVRETHKELDAQPDVNYEGQPSFSLGTKEAFVNTLLCNMLGGSFYASEKDLIDKARKVHEDMLAEDPLFYAKAIVYARNRGFVREQPAIGLTYLSTLPTKELVYTVFDNVARIPSDITKFIDYSIDGGIRNGLGNTSKALIRRWLKEHLSEYYAIKYPVDIRRAIRLSHPNTKDWGDKDSIATYLMKGYDPIFESVEKNDINFLAQIQAFEKLKRDPKNKDLITKGRLPHEVVTAVASMDSDAWATLMKQMPYFALLRNLATLDRHGILEDEDYAEYVAKRLSEPQAVHKSKLFPFRFWNAYRTYTGYNISRYEDGGGTGNPLVAQALADALELSFDNVPDIPGKTLVAMDSSGSMSGPINEKSVTRYVDIAAIFATVALKKAGKGSEAVAFDTTLKQLHINPNDSVMTTVSRISLPGGGTDCGLPLQYAIGKQAKFDNVVIITDSIEWHTSYGGYGHSSAGFLAEWRRYRAKWPKAQCFYIRIDPYMQNTHPQEEPGIVDFYGWNENVLRVVAAKAKGLSDQIAEIEAVDL